MWLQGFMGPLPPWRPVQLYILHTPEMPMLVHNVNLLLFGLEFFIFWSVSFQKGNKMIPRAWNRCVNHKINLDDVVVNILNISGSFVM